MVRKVCLLGSTGSVGTSTLSVIRQHSSRFEVVGLACGQSIEVLKSQIEEFAPAFVSVGDEVIAQALKDLLPSDSTTQIFWGVEGHKRLVQESKPDVLMSSMSGTYGLRATLQAVIDEVPVVGIANKEILVMAGPFILDALETSRSELVPVDSEHSAIFQALMGNNRKQLKKIILTGSGGPFRTRDPKTFSQIQKAEALKHPNWNMGAKITVDSSTMMNKGLEYIEAIRLFDVPPDKIEVLIHPESIVHSMVEYVDGSMMAQLGVSDMRIPISLALAYPDRLAIDLGKSLNLAQVGKLHFEEPNFERFPCLKLAMHSELMGSQGPIVLNAANEIAVARFLNEEIRYIDIAGLVEDALGYFEDSQVFSLEDVIELDKVVKAWSQAWTRVFQKGRLQTPSRETLGL